MVVERYAVRTSVNPALYFAYESGHFSVTVPIDRATMTSRLKEAERMRVDASANPTPVQPYIVRVTISTEEITAEEQRELERELRDMALRKLTEQEQRLLGLIK